MRIIRSVIVAFSMYSRIPMPQFRWEDADTKYMLCFFPWVGAVIGAAVWFFTRLCDWLNIGLLCETFAGAAIPLLITGGFHADGFLDTSDALHSYQSRERKLEILKDSHVGAFAVIRFAIYGILYLAKACAVTDFLCGLLSGTLSEWNQCGQLSGGKKGRYVVPDSGSGREKDRPGGAVCTDGGLCGLYAVEESHCGRDGHGRGFCGLCVVLLQDKERVWRRYR